MLCCVGRTVKIKQPTSLSCLFIIDREIEGRLNKGEAEISIYNEI